MPDQKAEKVTREKLVNEVPRVPEATLDLLDELAVMAAKVHKVLPAVWANEDLKVHLANKAVMVFKEFGVIPEFEVHAVDQAKLA